MPVTDLCRKLRISESTFYAWKTRYAGMGVVEMRQVKQLEDDKRRLKGLVADVTQDRHMLQEVLRKEAMRPAALRERGHWLVGTFSISRQRACGLVRLGRLMLYWRSKAKDQTPLRTRLRELAAAQPRFGHPRLHVLLRREGWHVNIKRVYRLYKMEEQGCPA